MAGSVRESGLPCKLLPIFTFNFTPSEQQQGEIISLNTAGNALDPVLSTGPKECKLLVLSTDAITVMSQKGPTPPQPSHHHSNFLLINELILYPALLSRVAEAFRDRITLSKLIKDGLVYHDAFDGQDAVDKIARIIRTTDRRVALLLGRALNAQRFFHDATYSHPLRDSSHEIYQLNERLPIPFIKNARVLAVPMASSSGWLEGEDPLPSGVFTFLTDCYSPTCNRDALCYSIACPRRLEQQTRLNMKRQPGLRSSLSDESLGDTSLREAGTLWIHSAPAEIVATMPDQEKKRQEAIKDMIYTERDFVQDMEYLQDSWVKPLRTTDIIPEHCRTQFVKEVFWNLDEIIAVSRRLRDALNKRQESDAIVKTIGQIYLDAVKSFDAFVWYGGHQLYGKLEFMKEKSLNPAFARFVEEAEARPESRKLEVMGYLTRPTTHLARYPLLLDVVLKYTPNDSPDKAHLMEVVDIIRGLLRCVNEKAESRLNLQLDQRLVFRKLVRVDLRLQDENRELLYKGKLTRRRAQGPSSEMQVFLLDHVLLVIKPETNTEQLRVYKVPIPLELLVVIAPEKPNTDGKDIQDEYPIIFRRLGRKGYDLTLLADTAAARKNWLEKIAKQQEVVRERSMTFDTVTLSEGFFFGENKVKCAAPFNHGSQVAYGADNGVYFSDLRDLSRPPVHVLALLDVTQVDVLEEYRLLLVLSERSVMAIPLDVLDVNDPTVGMKRAKKVSSSTSFFKVGICLGRTLVCIVKANVLSTTLKVLEPIDQALRGNNKPILKKLLQGGNDTLKIFKEFYIPAQSTSVHFLKTKLCVGLARGFEVIDLETLDTQSLLDPADPSLDFVRKQENARPIAIYRIENKFLLCYNEFAFYVNKQGCRARPNWIINWKGSPTSFALYFPFVLAFEPTFIEVYTVETGQLEQIIPGKNLRCLFSEIPPSIKNSAATHTNPYVRGNPYIYPQVAGTYSQEEDRDLPSTASSTPLSFTRDEIIVVSDDKVMAVQLASPPALRQQLAAASRVPAEERSGDGSVVSVLTSGNAI
ncbi:RHO1 GDP-GTP exchange protein 2 [Tulasnella sp. UAMH 9824]|nr:RHO1 GDP-GTP exchange protein 2 [Tulasnella sp. UAMH 9824]